MSDKTELYRSRRGTKSTFTKKLNCLEKLVTSKRPESEVNKAITDLTKTIEKLEEVHEKYCMCLSDTEFVNEENYLDEILSKFGIAHAQAQDYLNTISADSKPVTDSSDVGQDGGRSNLDILSPCINHGQSSPGENGRNEIQEITDVEPSENLSSGSKIHLRSEKAPNPKFDGTDILEYLDFKSDFSYLFKKHGDKDKMYLLKRCVSGKAREWIQCELDPDRAFKTLDKIYGDSRVISDELIQRITKFNTLSENDPRLKGLYHLLKKAESLLSRIERSNDLDNSTMLMIVEKKLPTLDRLKWAEYQLKCDVKNPNMSLLLEFVENQIYVRQIAGVTNASMKQTTAKVNLAEKTVSDEFKCSSIPMSSNNQPPAVNFTEKPGSSEGKLTPTSATSNWTKNGTKNNYCWYCKGSHAVAECGKFKELTPNERLREVRESHACFCCLKIHRGKCFLRKRCGEMSSGVQCVYSHHQMLHHADFKSGSMSKASGSCGHARQINDQISDENSYTLLPIISVNCCSTRTEQFQMGNILLDSGSQLSLISETFAEELGLQGRSTKLSVIKVGGDEESYDSKTYKLRIRSANGQLNTITVMSIPRISENIEFDSGVRHKIAKVFGISDEGAIARCSGPISILLGIDLVQYHTGQTETRDNLIAKKTILGTVYFGATNATVNNTSMLYYQEVSVEDGKRNDENIERFWDTEEMGIRLNDCCTAISDRRKLSPTDIEEYDRIAHSAELVDGQWEIPYPWIKDPTTIPNNYPQALAKLYSTERRLAKIPGAAEQYGNQIGDMVKRGCARKLNREEMNAYKGPVHYNSHHMVTSTKPGASTPHRVVFNPKCKYQGLSLNECLIKGPDLLNSLVGVMIRFREEEVGYVGDIRKCYHQVRVTEVDAHMTRFLWRKMETDRTPDVYCTDVITFGMRPAPAMANIAIDLTADRMSAEYELASHEIKSSRYMDDIVGSQSSVEKVAQLTADIDSVLKSGHFEIKCWASNAAIPGNSVEPEMKVLGIVWQKELDQISLDIKPRSREGDSGDNDQLEQVLTKRKILSRIASIYDYFGIGTAVTIRGKIGLQRLWREKKDWDDPLDYESKKFWLNWFMDMDQLGNFTIPRCLRPAGAGETSLIIFSDASVTSFGAIAYSRYEIDGSGKFGTRLIMAKSKVAPIKSPLTIPRLELQGILVGCRIKNTIMQESRLHWDKCVFFTDSKVALSWVKDTRREYKQFVSPRVTEIRRAIDVEEIRYCRTDLNVADHLTKGLTASQLRGEWESGPKFLSLPESEWPDMGDDRLEISDHKSVEEEVKGQTVMVAMHSTTKPDPILDCLKKISDFHRVVRIVGTVNRAAHNFLALMKSKKNTRKMEQIVGSLSVEEISQAEITFIRVIQREIDRKAENVRNLGPLILDENGLLRVGGRCENADVSYDMKHPILITPKHWAGKLLIRKAHQGGHTGTAATVAKCNRKYWVLQASKLAKSVRHQCVFCREWKAKTEVQQMADLPQDRLRPFSPPFHATAVDLFGPFTVKFGKYKTEKVWGVLYTCMNVRAVFLDVTVDYGTDGFLMSFRRFMSIHGKPSVVYSDNGGHFTGTKEYCKSQGIKWIFFCPKAAHANGCSESLIKTSKYCLAQVIGKQPLWPLELQTILFEVANTMNERPVGIIRTDPGDGKCLTPNDMLLGRSSSTIPQGPFRIGNADIERFEFTQRLLNQWWKRWYRDVFPLLLPRRKWHTLSRNVQVGDYCLVKDENAIRGQFTKGVISKTYPDKQGKVRNVQVKTASAIYDRPITHIVILYPVEGYTDG